MNPDTDLHAVKVSLSQLVDLFVCVCHAKVMHRIFHLNALPETITSDNNNICYIAPHPNNFLGRCTMVYLIYKSKCLSVWSYARLHLWADSDETLQGDSGGLLTDIGGCMWNPRGGVKISKML